MFDWLIWLIGALDGLPILGRALLSAAVLSGLFYALSTRLNPSFAGLGVSFRKTSLLLLLLVPTVCVALLQWRLVVIVVEMPARASAPSVLWYGLLFVWLAGIGYHGRMLYQKLLADAELAAASSELDENFTQRFDHWRKRLDVEKEVKLGCTITDSPWAISGHVLLPKEAARWPAAVQDAIVIHELCHIKHNSWHWLVFGYCIAVLYWPIRWVKKLVDDLAIRFQQTSDARAVYHYNDRLGYARALRHVAKRLEDKPVTAAVASPQPLLIWPEGEWMTIREKHLLDYEYSDPNYDLVFWRTAPALFAMFVLVGTTLQQYVPPPDRKFQPAFKWEVSFLPARLRNKPEARPSAADSADRQSAMQPPIRGRLRGMQPGEVVSGDSVQSAED